MRQSSELKLIFALVAGLAALAACGRGSVPVTTTPPASATSTPTASPSPTATPTPTPTATAQPAIISGEPRALSTSEPVRQSGAPCGFVDTLDFPLDPPDAAAATGGSDFGRFRERYDGYHAGEDWRLGGSSFGRPVHAIAHGLVIYAQPLGWGADKGVVIVQHTFHDGRRILSFYGHLDPPSLTLFAGECIQRGDQVGEIGDPRTRPHLHFEVRLHLPDTPGPGYWPVDPALAGWRPPSATIWNERVAVLPGVLWTRLDTRAELQPLGLAGQDLLMISGNELQAFRAADGKQSWTFALPEPARTALLDDQGGLLYLAGAGGVVHAYTISALSNAGPESIPEPSWRVELSSAQSPALYPLPEGGVLAVGPTEMAALGRAGMVLWTGDDPASGITDWAHSRGMLLLIARNGVWSIDRRGATQWAAAPAAERVVASDQPFAYGPEGVYRLDFESRAAELFYPLPDGFARLGDLVELPSGGVLVAHRDLDDTRLLALESDGRLRWERSIRSLGAHALELLAVGDQIDLVVQFDSGNTSLVDIFRVDQNSGELLRLFSGGSRASISAPIATALDDRSVAITIDGVGLAIWQPQAAIDALQGE